MIKKFIFPFIGLLLFSFSNHSYCQVSKKDSMLIEDWRYEYKPDFYAVNEDGVEIAYMYVDSVFNKRGENLNSLIMVEKLERTIAMVKIDKRVKTHDLAVTYHKKNLEKSNFSRNYSADIIKIPSEVIYDGEIYHVKYISDLAFSKSNSVKEIHVPSSVKRIYNAAFMQMAELERIKFDGDLRQITQQAFYELPSLKRLDFPKTNYVGINVIGLCPNLEVITYDELNKEDFIDNDWILMFKDTIFDGNFKLVER